ncbi:MAG: class I SAM-dependent methyltransferase [Solirubrobacterales bacterium]|nr:class I SAM-dependent methyltransferase [Solirubrobacterales bacterium]
MDADRSLLAWKDGETLVVGGVEFLVTDDPNRYTRERSTADRLVLVKPTRMVESLVDLLVEFRPKRIVELGIYSGGSVALIAQVADPDRLSAIELSSEPVAGLSQFIAANGLEEVVKTHYGLDQADVQAVRGAIDVDHGDQALDLVIDDASHFYVETRTAFELLFPRLRPGGLYVIEDWDWAHMPGPLWQHAGGYFHDRPALTNLIVELSVLSSTADDLVRRVVVNRQTAIVERGDRPCSGPLRLEDLYRNRGLPFRPIL